jgi:hypothetical protein
MAIADLCPMASNNGNCDPISVSLQLNQIATVDVGDNLLIKLVSVRNVFQ